MLEVGLIGFCYADKSSTLEVCVLNPLQTSPFDWLYYGTTGFVSNALS